MFRKQMLLLVVGACGLAGCSKPVDSPVVDSPKVENSPATDKVSTARAKLEPADRALVEAQEWCVISTKQRLGSMGKPIKLDIKGQPVFVCCDGCKEEAEAAPDATLAKVAELKAKAKLEKK